MRTRHHHAVPEFARVLAVVKNVELLFTLTPRKMWIASSRDALVEAIGAIADPVEAACAFVYVQNKLPTMRSGVQPAERCQIDDANIRDDDNLIARVTKLFDDWELAERENSHQSSLADLLIWIGANLDQAMNDATLAKRTGMTLVSFRRRFKNLVGMSPHDYVARQRVQLASQLMQQGTKHEAVARMVGFACKSSLYRALRRHITAEGSTDVDHSTLVDRTPQPLT